MVLLCFDFEWIFSIVSRTAPQSGHGLAPQSGQGLAPQSDQGIAPQSGRV